MHCDVTKVISECDLTTHFDVLGLFLSTCLELENVTRHLRASFIFALVTQGYLIPMLCSKIVQFGAQNL